MGRNNIYSRIRLRPKSSCTSSPYYVSRASSPLDQNLAAIDGDLEWRKSRYFHSSYSNIQSKCQASVTSQSEDFPETSSQITNTETQSKSVESIASYKSIITFVATTVLIWLSEPILSLVDTTVLGRFGSSSSAAVIQLAALGPATLLIDSAVYLTYFLAIATTNQLAKAIAEKDVRTQRKTTSHALGVASFLGFLITTTVLAFGVPMLKWIIKDVGPESTLMLRDALQYARIRCLAAPLAVMGIVAQSAALASLDTWTPFLAVMVSSATNIIGDFILCVYPFKMGIKGAALATAAASALGSITLLFATKKRLNRLKNLDVPSPHSSSTNGLAKDLKPEHIPFASFPDRKSLWNLVKLAGPIFFVITGKLICYSAMTLKATKFGVVPLACHNIMLRIFFFFATFGDSLSQSAQTFLPQVLYSQNKDNEVFANNTMGIETDSAFEKKIERVDTTESKSNQLVDAKKRFKLQNLFRRNKERTPLLTMFSRQTVVAAVISLVNQQVACNILTTKSRLFTSETSISTMMSTYAPWIRMCLLLHPFIMLFEGSIIASRDLGYLVGCYGMTICLLLGQLEWFCGIFDEVWKSLFLLQFFRFVLFGTRVWRRIVLREKKKKSINAQ